MAATEPSADEPALAQCTSGAADGSVSISKNKGVRLRKQPSGLHFVASTNRGATYAESFEQAMIELKRWAATQGEAMEQKLKGAIEHVAVTYIMTDGSLDRGRSKGHYLDAASIPDQITAIARLLPKAMTDEIDDKRTFGRLAKEAGVEGTVVPRTFESAAEAFEVLAADPAASDIVFVKSAHGSGGDAITVERTTDLKTLILPRHHIIQEGVTSKSREVYKLRAFVIVHGGKLYLSKNFHGYRDEGTPTPEMLAAYSPEMLAFVSSRNLTAQHVNQHWDSTIDRHTFWAKMGGRAIAAAEAPHRQEWTASMAAATKRMAPMFKLLVTATANDPYRYHLLGIDVIPREDHSVRIIEVNPFPGVHWDHMNFSGIDFDFLPEDQKFERNEVCKEQNGAFVSILKLLFGMPFEDGLIDVSGV